MPILSPTSLQRPSRGLALALAVLVFGLGLLSTAPGAHEHLHHDAAHPDHVCAIELFAQGVASAVAPLALTVTWAVWAALALRPTARRIASPAHRLPPGRAPPTV